MVQPGSCFSHATSSSFADVPMPSDNKNDVEDIKPYHGSTFPRSKVAINQKHHTETCCNGKESDVSYETPPGHVERLDQRHTSSDNRSDESSSSNQFPDGQATTIALHCRKCREY